MKILGVDVSVKYISFELDGKPQMIQFHNSLLNGIYDVSVWKENNETDAKITGAYPPLREWFPEIWRIWFPVWWKGIIRKCRQLHNR